MAQQYQYVCDGCGATVHGKDRNAFIHHEYIQFKNTAAVLQMMDPKTRWKSHTFLTRAPGEDLTFCLKPGLPCIEQYIESKQRIREFHRQDFLRREAAGENIRRLHESN